VRHVTSRLKEVRICRIIWDEVFQEFPFCTIRIPAEKKGVASVFYKAGIFHTFFFGYIGGIRRPIKSPPMS
jgi:hypothetical protein